MAYMLIIRPVERIQREAIEVGPFRWRWQARFHLWVTTVGNPLFKSAIDTVVIQKVPR